MKLRYIPWALMQIAAGVVAVVAVCFMWPFTRSKHVGHDDDYEGI